jgi:hypothetical protein
MLASPRMRRRKSRAHLPRLQLRNVCYNKTSRRSGCALFLTRLSNQRITARRFCKGLTRADVCPKGQPIDTGYPAHTQFSFFAKRIVFQNNGSFFSTRMLSLCILAEYTEGGFFQYLYGAHAASASGRHKLKTMCNETWQHVPQHTRKQMRVLKCGA